MSLTAWLFSIATDDPCDEGKNKGVAEEQVYANTNTEMKNSKYHFFVIRKNLAASVWLYVSWFPIYGSAGDFLFDVAWRYTSQLPPVFTVTPFVCFFDLGCRYPGQSPGVLQLRWCFLLFRLLVIDHVCNRVKHGNVTQLDTVPVDDLFLTIFYLSY